MGHFVEIGDVDKVRELLTRTTPSDIEEVTILVRGVLAAAKDSSQVSKVRLAVLRGLNPDDFLTTSAKVIGLFDETRAAFEYAKSADELRESVDVLMASIAVVFGAEGTAIPGMRGEQRREQGTHRAQR